MFCKNCGEKLSKDSKFCSFCGGEQDVSLVSLDNNNSKEEVLFYSKDWERKDGFRGNYPPVFDIAITKDFCYLIKLPNSNLAQDVILQFPTGIVGILYKNPMWKKLEKAVNKFRLSGFDTILKKRFLTSEYQKNIFIKIPKESFKSSILFKTKKRILGKEKLVVFNYNDKKITLSSKEEEYERFMNKI